MAYDDAGWGVFVFLGIVVVSVFATVFMSMPGCGSEEEPFIMKVDGQQVMLGEMLYTKLSGDKVQVLGFYSLSHKIHCRVQFGRRYRDGMASRDSFGGEYVFVKFMPMELTRTLPPNTEEIHDGS